jgi:hypothetical protein
MTVAPSNEGLRPHEGLRLETPDEPTALRDELRSAVFDGMPWPDGLGNDTRIGLWLWQVWRGAIEPLGLDRETFLETVAAYRREQWLWLVGERRWDAFLSGLSGRVARRLPSG